MGKRSSFPRVERDFYPTPAAAVVPLLPHLAPGTRYIEPCVGNGALARHLDDGGHRCVLAFDVEPHCPAKVDDARDYVVDTAFGAAAFITNPPWSRTSLHPIIDNLSRQLPTWLLFDAGWVHTRQAEPWLRRLRKIVSVGRLKWIPDSPYTGKDDCAWHLFDARSEAPCVFHGRVAA